MAKDQISENVADEVANNSLVLDWLPLGDSNIKLLCDISQRKLDQWYQLLGEKEFLTCFMVYPTHL